MVIPFGIPCILFPAYLLDLVVSILRFIRPLTQMYVSVVVM